MNRDVITLDGTDFVAFNGNTDDIGNKLSDDVSTIDYAQTYELYVTDDDQFVGFKAVGDIAVDDIVYALGVLTVTQKNDYGDTITEYKARCIDMEAKERLIVIGKDLPVDGLVGSTGAGVTRGFYSVKAHTGRDEKKEEIQVLTPVTNTYDGKGGYFVSGASKGAEAGFTSNSYGFVKSDDGMLTYGKPFSKYIFVDGDLNSPFELDVQSVDSMKAYTNYDSMEMLLSRNENGVSNDVVVMVVYGVSASTVNSNDSIYITAQQLKEYEQTAEGYVYSGYTPVDGAPAQVTVKNKLAGNESSFYMIQNRTGDLPTLNPVGHNEKFGTTDYIAYRNVAIQGFAEGLTVVGFNVADENGTAGIKLPWNASASVVVVDTRTQPEQDSSKTGLITSINQLNDLVARDPSR
ncbi:MAG: hypothetical protein IKL13_01050, partial [Clostridia bacterium]|nr:hypothetical protein [Clostridia bacterium]